jgi:hypothetical protein
LRISSSVAILCFDWAVFAITLSRVHDWPYATVFGSFGAALTVALMEQWSGATFTQVALRAVIAGAIVALPLPLLGTLVAVTFLIWSAVAHADAHRAH